MKKLPFIAVAMSRDKKSSFVLRSAILSALTGLALVIALNLSPAHAQSEDVQRYSMEKTDSGILRLDRQTGDVALCVEQAGKIVCADTKPAQLTSDERVVLLEKQVADLTVRLSNLEKHGSVNSTLPSETEFEKGLSYMERFMRLFMDEAKSFDEPAKAPSPT